MHEDEEHEMPSVCKHGVCDANECRYEICLHRYTEVGDRETDACANHANNAR